MCVCTEGERQKAKKELLEKLLEALSNPDFSWWSKEEDDA